MRPDNMPRPHAPQHSGVQPDTDALRGLPWAELRKLYVTTMAQIDLRFRSGNSTPIERAHITANEWALIGAHEDACEDMTTTMSFEIDTLRAELSALRARVEESGND